MATVELADSCCPRGVEAARSAQSEDAFYLAELGPEGFRYTDDPVFLTQIDPRYTGERKKVVMKQTVVRCGGLSCERVCQLKIISGEYVYQELDAAVSES